MEKSEIYRAEVQDIKDVLDLLSEAASWLDRCGMPMWRDNELTPDQISADVVAGLFFLAKSENTIVGTIKFQLEDQVFWPDATPGEAAYLHRLAVCQRSAGGHVSSLLLGWAAHRACDLGKRYVRLDCEAWRVRLRSVYERFGFRHHSDRQIGPYFVARYQLEV